MHTHASTASDLRLFFMQGASLPAQAAFPSHCNVLQLASGPSTTGTNSQSSSGPSTSSKRHSASGKNGNSSKGSEQAPMSARGAFPSPAATSIFEVLVAACEVAAECDGRPKDQAGPGFRAPVLPSKQQGNFPSAVFPYTRATLPMPSTSAPAVQSSSPRYRRHKSKVIADFGFWLLH